MKAVYDDRLIRCEIYNPNKFDIIFTRDKSQDNYVRGAGIFLGADIIICKSDGFAILPHCFYIPKASNGADLINVVQNFGDSIGKGNKLPSLPIVETKKQSNFL
jgi:hypothetical protein